MLFDVDFGRALHPGNILKECRRIVDKKLEAINRKAAWADEYRNIRDYSGSRLNLVLWPGILKAFIEAKGFITRGPPSYENTILFMEGKLGNHNIPLEFKYEEVEEKVESSESLLGYEVRIKARFDDDKLVKCIDQMLHLLRDKYNHEPEYYSALPISHIQSSSAKSNICVDLHPEVLELHPDFEEWMLKLSNTRDGVISFTVGISESIIGLIPLYERGLLDFGLEGGFSVFKLRENTLAKRLWGSLNRHAEPMLGSPLYARHVIIHIIDELIDDVEKWIFWGQDERVELYSKLIDSNYARLMKPLDLKGYESMKYIWEHTGEKEEWYGIRTTDPYELYRANYAIGAPFFGTPEYKGIYYDERIDKVLNDAMEKYLDVETRRFIVEARAKSRVDYNDPVHVKKRELLKDISVKHGRDWHRDYWDAVKSVGEDIMDMTPKRDIKRDKTDLKLFLIGIGEAYIYYHRFFAFNLMGFPIIKAELRMLRDYLKEHYGIKFDWRDILKYSIGTLTQAGRVAVVGRDSANKYRKYAVKPKIRLSPHQRPAYKEDRKKVEDSFSFDWLRYERLLDEAKENLDNFNRFKQLYYLQRAIDAYEDAKRILYDIYNRYRKYKDKERIIIEKLILINRQIDEVKNMMSELRKEGY